MNTKLPKISNEKMVYMPFKIVYIYTVLAWVVLKKLPKLKTDTKKPDKTDLPLQAAFRPS